MTEKQRPLAEFGHLAPPDTLRRAALEGRLSAQKLGRDWVTTEGNVRRYLRSRYHVSKRPFFVKELDTNHCQVDSGWVDYGFDRWVARYDLEIVTRDPLRAIVRAEWGNGEGYDTFAVEFSPEPDDESEALEK